MAITLGLKTNTHLYIVSETTLSERIMKIKDTENTVVCVGGVLASITGDQADAFRTKAFIEEYSKMVSLKYRQEITPALVARLLATHVHDGLRSHPLEVQGIVGGLDRSTDDSTSKSTDRINKDIDSSKDTTNDTNTKDGNKDIGINANNTPGYSTRLFAVDKYGALHEDNFVATGYGLYFLFGIYDLYYKPDMSAQDSEALLMRCMKTMKERLVLETDKWRIDILGPEGYRTEFVDLNASK